jgi:hypothetical protein
VAGHTLRDLDTPAVGEATRHPCGAEGVAANRGLNSRIGSPAVASSEDSTALTLWLPNDAAPWAECAGFDGIACPATSQPNCIRTQAKCCVTAGADRPPCTSPIYAATCTAGRARVRHPLPFAPAQEADRAYAVRVFLLRMLTVKNSRKRHPARSPAPTMSARSSGPDA